MCAETTRIEILLFKPYLHWSKSGGIERVWVCCNKEGSGKTENTMLVGFSDKGDIVIAPADEFEQIGDKAEPIAFKIPAWSTEEQRMHAISIGIKAYVKDRREEAERQDYFKKLRK